MFQKVSNRNVGFTLPGGLTVVLKHLKKKSRKILKNLLILAGLAPFLFTRPATAQVRTTVLQTAVVPAATQTTTDEATQKRIEELITQLGDKNWRVCQSAARTLGRIGQPAVEPLIKALNDTNSRGRGYAALALARIGDPQAVQSLIKALGDKRASVRSAAAIALGEIGDPQAVQPLVKVLEDENGNVRLRAAEALGRIGNPQAVQSLIKALGDEDGSVRRYAAGALRRIGSPQAARALKKKSVYLAAVKVLSIVSRLLIPLLVLCPPIFLAVSIFLLLKHEGYSTKTVLRAIRAILVYLAVVIGNVLCPPILILLGFVLSEFLGLIGIYWLAMTIGWVIVFVQDVLGSSDRGLIFLVVPFAYFASFFLPLFGFLCFKKRTAKNRCKVVQALFIVLHIVFHLYLIVYHNLFDKIIEFIRV